MHQPPVNVLMRTRTNTSPHLGVTEVERTASELEVRAAYRSMAKKYHPDGKGNLMFAEFGAVGGGPI